MNRRSLIRNLLALPIGIAVGRLLPTVTAQPVDPFLASSKRERMERYARWREQLSREMEQWESKRRPPSPEEMEQHLRRGRSTSPVAQAIHRIVDEATKP